MGRRKPLRKGVVRYKEVVCEVCGNIMVIPRHPRRDKRSGHVKHIWCFKCRNVTAHIEK